MASAFADEPLEYDGGQDDEDLGLPESEDDALPVFGGSIAPEVSLGPAALFEGIAKGDIAVRTANNDYLGAIASEFTRRLDRSASVTARALADMPMERIDVFSVERTFAKVSVAWFRRALALKPVLAARARHAARGFQAGVAKGDPRDDGPLEAIHH
jgi:plasmid stabilization system protein ParE